MDYINSIIEDYYLVIPLSSGTTSFVFTIIKYLAVYLVSTIMFKTLLRTNPEAFLEETAQTRIEILMIGQKVKSGSVYMALFDFFYNSSKWKKYIPIFIPIFFLIICNVVILQLTLLSLESIFHPVSLTKTFKSRASLILETETGLMDNKLEETAGSYFNQNQPNYWKYISSTEPYIEMGRFFTRNKVCVAPGTLIGKELNNTKFSSICQWVDTECSTNNFKTNYTGTSIYFREKFQYMLGDNLAFGNGDKPTIQIFDIDAAEEHTSYTFSYAIPDANITYELFEYEWKGYKDPNKTTSFKYVSPPNYRNGGFRFLNNDGIKMFFWAGTCKASFVQCDAEVSSGEVTSCINRKLIKYKDNLELPIKPEFVNNHITMTLAFASQDGFIYKDYANSTEYILSKSLLAWYVAGNIPKLNSVKVEGILTETKFVIYQRICYLPLLLYAAIALVFLAYFYLFTEKSYILEKVFVPEIFISLFKEPNEVVKLEFENGNDTELTDSLLENH